MCVSDSSEGPGDADPATADGVGCQRREQRRDRLDLSVGRAGPDLAASLSGKDALEGDGQPIEGATREPSGIREPAHGRRRLRRNDIGERIGAAVLEVLDDRVAGTGEIAAAPAGLGEVEVRVAIERPEHRQQFELGACELDRARSQVQTGEPQVDGVLADSARIRGLDDLELGTAVIDRNDRRNRERGLEADDLDVVLERRLIVDGQARLGLTARCQLAMSSCASAATGPASSASASGSMAGVAAASSSGFPTGATSSSS